MSEIPKPQVEDRISFPTRQPVLNGGWDIYRKELEFDLQIAHDDLQRFSQKDRDYILDDKLPLLKEAISNPEDFYKEGIGDRSPEELRRDRIRLSASFLASANGDPRGFINLGQLLLTEHINTKMYIMNFLGALTEGKIGELEPEVPTKDNVLSIVGKINQAISSRRLE